MKSVILPSYNRNIIRAMLGLRVLEVELPVPVDNEVLIKVHASPVNPSDIAFIQGNYNIVKTLPATPGFEASGVVMDAGKNAQNIIGSKVSCFVQNDGCGTWSEYLVASKEDVIVLKDEMNMDQASCFTVNPFTAYGMFDIALQREATAIIQNAAGGQVANFIRVMAKNNNIEVINIVRKQETAHKLIAEGANYVLVDTDDDFIEKLLTISSQLNPTVAFDAVGGSVGGIMINALAPDSELVVYGGLSGKPMSDVDLMGIIFDNKIISGFNLIDWKADISKDEFDRISLLLQDGFISGNYNTAISDVVDLDNIVAGLRSYIANMSKGKLLIKP